MLHFRRYIAALAVLLAAFGLYFAVVPPWLEPPSHGKRAARTGPSAPVQASLGVKAELERLFQPTAWERDSKTKIVETDQGTLLIHDYLPTPDGRLELKPCTLIFYTNSDAPAPPGDSAAGDANAAPPSRRPIVLQAPEGAVLQFDRPLDIGRGEFGQIVGGRLVGEITIFSPPSKPGAADALHLVTRSVQLEEDRIFTPHDVEFRYGESHGRGRDLTIAMLPKDQRLVSPKAAAFGDIQSLTLAHIDRLHLVSGGPNSPGANAGGPKEAPTRLEVTCQGPFVIDLMQQFALFDEQVEVLRLVSGSAPDRLRCDRLLLEFIAPREKSTDRSATDSLPTIDSAPPALRPANQNPALPVNAPPPKPAEERLAGNLERIVAFGRPAVLESPSSAARAVAARMEYSLVKRRIVLVPSKAAPQVSLRHQTQEFTARELEYEFPAEGQLGRLWAAGPGQLKMVQERAAGPQTFIARWEKELRIRPDGQNKVISLIDGASISVEPLGRFDAEQLHLWVQERLVDDPANSGAGESGQKLTPASLTPAGSKPRTTIVPDRLLATGAVRVEAPQLHAETSRLEVWFLNIPPKPGTSQALAPATPFGPPPLTAGGPAQRLPSPQKFGVRGGLIQMQVQVQGRELALEDLTIRERAKIDEVRTAEPGQEPIHLAGDRLELQRGTTPQATIEVTGNPAEVGGRGMSLIGEKINVLRGENRVWIDGPGEATLPVPEGDSLPLGPPGTAPRPVREPGLQIPPGPPKKLHLVWQHGLNFNGQTVRLEGEVVGRTATQLVKARTLDATLSRPIDMNATGARDPVELGRLHLDGGVYLLNSGFDERGQKISHDQLQAKNLTIDRLAGTLNADGPGWVNSVRRMAGGFPGAAAGREASPPAPMPPDTRSGEPSLTSIHIEFERRIVGDLARREITFQHNIRTTYSPTSDFMKPIVARTPEDLGEQGVLMTSDKLIVTEMLLPDQKWIEMQAKDNTLIEGRQFTVRAANVRYAGDKEVLTVEGDGRADAQIWYQAVPGEPRTHTAARKFRYWLRDGTFDGEDFSVLDVQQIGRGLKIRGGQR